uniref:DUF2428 domain-containing protein n=1 Tax=Macrostomum lignano TaxID=282301 RepID=A0A1I8H6Y1_9PLAT
CRSRNRQQAPAAGQIRANSEWLARLIPSAIGADRARVLLRRQLEADVAHRRQTSGAAAVEAVGDLQEVPARVERGVPASNRPMATWPPAAAALRCHRLLRQPAWTHLILQRLDPCVQKLVLLLTSPPDPDRAPATVRSLWRANCAQALAELRSVAEQGPDSETAQRVLSPDAVAILLQLLPRLQPGDEAPVGPLQALLAGALISHKISPAEPLTLATVRHLLSRLASSESNSSQDLNSAGANLQLLAALCLNVGQFAQHQGLLRDTIRRLIDRLSRWPTSPDEGETLSGEGDDYNLSACQFYAAQALANLAYLRPTDQRDCLPPDLVSTLLTRCLALLESASDRPSARVLQLLLHLLTFLIS